MRGFLIGVGCVFGVLLVLGSLGPSPDTHPAVAPGSAAQVPENDFQAAIRKNNEARAIAIRKREQEEQQKEVQTQRDLAAWNKLEAARKAKEAEFDEKEARVMEVCLRTNGFGNASPGANVNDLCEQAAAKFRAKKRAEGKL